MGEIVSVTLQPGFVFRFRGCLQGSLEPSFAAPWVAETRESSLNAAKRPAKSGTPLEPSFPLFKDPATLSIHGSSKT